MRIKSIRTYSGQSFQLNKFTLLVGPNNSGKSQTLRDIKNTFERGQIYQGKLIDYLVLDWPESFEKLTGGISQIDSVTSLGYIQMSGLVSDLLTSESFQYHQDAPADYNSGSVDKEQHFLGHITKYLVAYLNSENRLQLGSNVPSIDPNTDTPDKILQTIVNDFDTEEELKAAFEIAFDMKIMFDASGFRHFNFRVAKTFPDIPEDPRKAGGITHGIPTLDEQGDGFRSFVGIILGLLKSRDRIILLDEPEAFLHPAQARYLGYWIASNIDKFSSQIIISTHSANFLHGILAGKTDVDVFRLNRQEDNTTFHLIPSHINQKFTSHPMLSSQRVLEAIFHKGAVVCEADADRAIYQGVAANKYSNQEILFLHGHSKDSLWQVVEVLKEAGVPIATIADIDILNAETSFQRLLEKSSGNNFPQKIESLREKIAESVNSISDKDVLTKLRQEVTEFLRQEHTLSGARSALRRIEKAASKWSTIKKSGKDAFTETVKSDVEEIFQYCKSIGIFIVPVGELEGWIKLEVKKGKWIITALEKVYAGDSPENLVSFIRDILDFFSADEVESREMAKAEAIVSESRL